MDCIIELKNIYAGYEKNCVLKNFNLKIYKNDKILIVGPNGAGKSTIFKVISGLIKVKSGKIILNRKDVTNLNMHIRMKEGVGYLLQKNNIITNLTVEDNLKLSSYFIDEKIFKNKLKKVFDIIPEFKYYLPIKAGFLSGGERQLLAIIMVLIREPKILLLDEPTAGLSPNNAKKVIDYILLLQNEFNIETICIVEHNIKYVLPLINNVIFLINGKIAFKEYQSKKLFFNQKLIEKFLKFGTNYV